MKPFDPRLARYARATRGYLALTVAVGLSTVVVVIAQASVLASAITGVFLDGWGLSSLRGPLVALGALVAARVALAWLSEVAAHRACAAAKSQLRQRLLQHVTRLGPAYLKGERAAELATVSTRGLDALDAYFARYLPQLVLAALVPAAVLGWIAPVDLVATATIALTLPLIPVFMALVGMATARRNERQYRALSRLAHHLLELIAGLPTLKVLGRAKAQARAIRELSDEQRTLTMRTLRLAFLSSLVLELLATISVALVAVGIGLRVVNGSLDLRTALVVLILAPEAYLPLRLLGERYHAAGEGLAAARKVFEVLAVPAPVRSPVRHDVPAHPAPIVVEEVGVAYPDRAEPALPPTSLRLPPGKLTAIVGPSGAGKTTLLQVLLGFVTPTTGRVLVGPEQVDLASLDPDAWRRAIGYVPQHPYLFAGTVASNIDLAGTATPEQIERAARLARLDGLPQGLSTVVGEGGTGLSAGQRQRVALARAFLHVDRSPAGGPAHPLVVLDEPTANLDAQTEAELVATIRDLARGRTVVLVAHHPALIAAADHVIPLPTPTASPRTDHPTPRADLGVLRVSRSPITRKTPRSAQEEEVAA